jgi:hypothetical protein
MEYAELFVEGAKICIAIKKKGITLYGNREAFQSLAKWMSYIANSDAGEHIECHLPWHFENYDSLFSKSSNVWTLFDKDIFPAFSKLTEDTKKSTKVTFMIVEDDDLSKLGKFRDSGVLPEGWANRKEGDKELRRQ